MTTATVTTAPVTQQDALLLALAEYRRRQDRQSHPDGTWDKAGRWYPAQSEVQACCTVRSPSRRWPYSLMTHCRTARHVAHLYGVDARALKAAVR